MNNLLRKRCISCCASLLLFAAANAFAQAPTFAYDLILQNGHVLDDKNHIDAVMDVAIKDGKIAAVAQHIAPNTAIKTIDVKGLYVTPGLIDIHFHAFINPGEKQLLRWRQQHSAGRLHVPRWGHYCGRRGLLRLA